MISRFGGHLQRIGIGKYPYCARGTALSILLCSDSSYFMTEPAHKKRKLTPGSQLDGSNELESEFEPFLDLETRQLLLAQEFDLEIALRKRLAATIESRVAWALILQHTLSNDVTSELAS